MNAETADFLERARDMLARADVMRGAELYSDAGRAAYLGAFHAAQALVFARLGKVFKTHSGVHAEFARLTLANEAFDRRLRGFLSRSYDLKVVADYEGGPANRIAPEDAGEAILESRRFIEAVATMLGDAAAGQRP